MKIQAVLILFAVQVSFASFLTPHQLKSLSKDQQREYLKGVQTIYVKMSENLNLIAASEDSEPSRSTASVEIGPETQDFLKQNNLTASDLEKHAMIATQTPANKRNTAEFKKSNAIWYAYTNQIKMNAETKKRHQERMAKIDALYVEDEATKKHREDHKKFLAEQTNKSWWQAYVSGPREAEKRRVLIDQRNKEEKASKQKEKDLQAVMAQSESEAFDPAYAKEQTEKSKEKKFFRCLFAGWVIKTDPCKGPSALPKEIITSLELDPQKATCRENEFACNPVLFGLKLPDGCASLSEYNPTAKEYCKKLATPICVEGFRKPTLYCKNQSSRFMNVAREINVELDSTFYLQFVKEFKELCDDDEMENNQMILFYKGKPRVNAKNIIADLRDTCNWADEQLIDLRNKMSVVEEKCSEGMYNLDAKGNRIKCKPFKNKKSKSQK